MHAFAAAALAFSYAQSMSPPAPQQLTIPHRAAVPAMMPSPLRIRKRMGSAASWVGGVVVSTQNALLDRSGVVPSVGRGDDADSPAVLSDEICLVPGSPIVRVEVAPGNARRIFTGIDIVAEVDDVLEKVWLTLTDYANLANVVPNLISNDIVERNADGARLFQRGAAKLAPGITFTAVTTLDVVEYMEGLPAAMEADHLADADADGGADTPNTDSAAVRKYGSAQPLTWDVFPRPYCISSLPSRDLTMQGVKGKGDFAFYQGVWRMQPLPGCAPPGSSAMRLTYSVELRPRAWVPVALLEGKIAEALAENLEAVRDYVTEEVAQGR